MKKTFINDDDLFAAIMKGDEQAKKQLYETIGPPLYGFALKWVKNKEAAEDILALAFSKSLSGAIPFDNLKHISCYVFNAVRWGCLDHKSIPSYYIPLDKIEETIAGDEQIEEDYIRFENRKAVFAQINALPKESDRRILMLTMAGKKPVEIAAETGLSAKYVRRRIAALATIIRNELLIKNIITVLLLLMFIKY